MLVYLFQNHIFLIKNKHLRTNLNIDLLEPMVFEYAHDYLDNRITNSLGVSNEQAPTCLHSGQQGASVMNGRWVYRCKFGTTANKGTRGSLVRMTPDVVYYIWACIDTSI